MFLGNGSVADTADAITRQDASGHCYGEKTQPNYEGNDCVLRKEHQMSALNKSHAEYEILKQYTFAAWAEETGYQPPKRGFCFDLAPPVVNPAKDFGTPNDTNYHLVKEKSGTVSIYNTQARQIQNLHQEKEL